MDKTGSTIYIMYNQHNKNCGISETCNHENRSYLDNRPWCNIITNTAGGI